MDRYAVVPDRRQQLALLVAGPDLDVIRLPRERRQAHVDGGFGVAVERPALVLRSGQAEAIEHLDLGVVNVDSAVAATLPACLGLERGAKLEVQLADAE